MSRLKTLFFLLAALPAAGRADFLIPFVYWHHDVQGSEQICVIVVLGDHYRRNFGAPDGLLPFLRQGRQEGDAFTGPFRDFNQGWYLNQVAERTDIYGEAGARIARQVDAPTLSQPGQVSAIYFYRYGPSGRPDFSQPSLSLRFVTSDAEGLLPVDRDYPEQLRGIQPPRGVEGEGLGVVPRLQTEGETGVVNLASPVQEQTIPVYRRGEVEPKSMGRDSSDPEIFRRFSPDLFQIAYLFSMFENSASEVPGGFRRFQDGSPVPRNGGAHVSLVRASCYSEVLMRRWRSLGFTVWHSSQRAGEPTHYFLSASPEDIARALRRIWRAMSREGSARLLAPDRELISRVRAVYERLHRTGRRLDCSRVGSLLSLDIPLELLPWH